MLSYEEILLIHKKASEMDPTAEGILSSDAILSAIGQPLQTFGGVDLYDGPIAKAAALGYFLIKAHGFQDGNKRVGYMAMKIALLKEGYHLKCDPDDGEVMVLSVAEGEAKLEDLTAWVEDHIYSGRENALVKATEGMNALLGPFDAISITLGAHNETRDRLVVDMNALVEKSIASKVKLDKMKRELFDRAASNMNFTARRLRFEIASAREAMEIIAEYAPLVSDDIDFSDVKVRADAETLKNTAIRIADSHDRVIDGLHLFRDGLQNTAELGVDAKMSEAAANLADAVSETSVMFNEDWFAWKDLLDGLVVSLDGN